MFKKKTPPPAPVKQPAKRKAPYRPYDLPCQARSCENLPKHAAATHAIQPLD